MDTRTLFQNIVQPDNSGQLPTQEGVVEFSSVFTTSSLGRAFSCPAGFFLLIIGASSSEMSMDSMIYLFPKGQAPKPGTVNDGIGNIPKGEIVFRFLSSTGQENPMPFPLVVGPAHDVAIYLNNIPVPPPPTIIVTVRALHLRDCPDNWKLLG